MNGARSQQQHVSLPLCILLWLCERASRRAQGLHCVCTGHPWCMMASCTAGTADASPQALGDLRPQFRFPLLSSACRAEVTYEKERQGECMRSALSASVLFQAGPH